MAYNLGSYVSNGNPTPVFNLIDSYSSFTNLFVVGSLGVTANAQVLAATLDHAYQDNMSFVSFLPSYWTQNCNVSTFFDSHANGIWKDHLLGFLYPTQDEPGGRQLDGLGSVNSGAASNPNEAANLYQNAINQKLNNNLLSRNNIATKYPLFTSDYAFYWFDYKGGYDGVFAEFGWNSSRQLNIALCRGAAEVQNKQWGVVITHTSTVPPYIESGPALFSDMVYAYKNGAKYIIIFDSDLNYTHSILQPEHLDAMRQFWTYIHNNPRNSVPISQRTALVLPNGYACGFRGPDDKVWGIWQSDDFTNQITSTVKTLLQQYGDRLDIVYGDSSLNMATAGYGNVVYWNDPSLQPTPSPTLLPTFTPTPAPSISPSPTPTPTPSSTPTTTPNPTEQITQEPTLSAPPNQNTDDPISLLMVSAFVIAAISVGAFAYFRKRSD